MDSDLYKALSAGNFCCVLTSRQMGKSSLRVRVMDRLQQDGVACSSIDVSFSADSTITAEHWYFGVMNRLVRDLDLSAVVNSKVFWKEHQEFAPSQRLDEFLDTILLKHISKLVVIFVDEIDSTIDLEFTDNFFAWIRYCYNLRADKPHYNRLTFCLLGVATPTDLIQDKIRTPFNIGKSIEPQQFQVEQLIPLMDGLTEQVEDIEGVCHKIHYWTGGQPYLTQRLCQLIQSELGKIEVGQEKESIARLVENRIITKPRLG